MDKHTTLKNVFKTDVSDSENLNATQEVNAGTDFEPSQSSIDLILNYSKSLSVQKNTPIGDVFTTLN